MDGWLHLLSSGKSRFAAAQRKHNIVIPQYVLRNSPVLPSHGTAPRRTWALNLGASRIPATKILHVRCDKQELTERCENRNKLHRTEINNLRHAHAANEGQERNKGLCRNYFGQMNARKRPRGAWEVRCGQALKRGAPPIASPLGYSCVPG